MKRLKVIFWVLLIGYFLFWYEPLTCVGPMVCG